MQLVFRVVYGIGFDTDPLLPPDVEGSDSLMPKTQCSGVLFV